MSIGMIIKKLRLERDWTQEQLAEYLGVSSRSISQWECGRTAPDISQLPVLCNIFEVSADILLGIDVEAKEKRIKEVIQKAQQQWKLGYNVEATKILREALKEFPNHYEIMSELMSCIWRVRDELENFDELTQEVIS